MGTIHRITDKIKVEVGDIVITISPLSKNQKSSLTGYLLKAGKGDMEAANEAVFLAVKYSVKKVDNVRDVDGELYQVDIQDGMLTDECVNDLLNMEEADKIGIIATSLLAKVPKVIVDANGKPVEGVRILPRVNSEGK